MNKYVKNFITVCMAVCMVVCLCLFASACGEDKNHYKVTVLMPDDSPAVGVSVGICSMDGSKLQCLPPVTTDSKGVASIDISDYSDTTKYVVHISNLPAGYVYADANGNPYDEDDQFAGDEVSVNNGYSTTIKLKAKSTADVPTTQSISIELANTSATQEVKPAIQIAGFYELVSVAPFTITGDGYSLTEGYYSVVLYLESGDGFEIGTTGNERRFTMGLSHCTVTGKSASSAFSSTAGSAYVLDLKAGEELHFVNPEMVNNHSGTPVVIDGNNYLTSASRIINVGDKFTVSTADGKAGTAVVFFNNVSMGTTATVGVSKDFEVLLVANGDAMNWAGENQECRISFAANQAGTYRVTVTSEYAQDLISISKAEYHDANLVVYQPALTTNSEAGVSYTVEFTVGAVANVGVTFTNGTASNTSASYVDYSSLNSDNVTYTVLVEFVG